MLFRGTLLADVLTGTTEADTIYGGGAETVPEDDADTILGGSGNDLIFGNGGDDLLVAQGDDDTVYGGVGDDSLYGGSSQTDTTDGSDALYAGVGSDWLYGNAGNDTLHGGDGTDTVYGGLGNDLIYGGNDYASGGDGSDFISSGAGSDTIYGGEGNDRIFGGNGVNDASDAADTIDGGLGNDILYGNGGDDLLVGGAGNDTIYGGAGLNTIEGGEGTDTIIANIGDVIFGGTGIDRFVLNARAIVTATTEAVVNNAEDLNQLRIKDLEAGEFLQINATDNRNISLSDDGNGNTQLTIDGEVVAVLEGVTRSEFSSGTNNANTLTYTVAGGNNSSGGGAAPNVAPTLTDLDAATFLENTVNASAQVIDAAVTFADADSANFAGGTLTVTYSAGGGVEDFLSVRHQGNGGGQIGFDGTTIRYASTAIGTIGTNGVSGANLVINFNTNATPTAVDALLQNLTYANSSNTPTATREISITVNDGDGATSTAATSVITVTAQAEVAAGSAAFVPSSLSGTNGFRLDGVAATDFSGYSVAGAGDVNGDGFEDVIIGARNVGASFNGASYIVFGKATGFTANVNLSALDGATGFKLNGIDISDNAGSSVGSAGDVNGDGFDDVIVGAKYADPSLRSRAGEAYVVFGKASGWAASIELSTLDGTIGFRVDGLSSWDLLGYSVASAGDVNGDGIADIIIGAKQAFAGDFYSGESYVIFGKTAGWASSFDLSTFNGSNGFSISGVGEFDYAGISVASAGDVNGDGFGDIIVGAKLADPGAALYGGASYIVFGKATGWGSTLDLATLDGTTGFRLDAIGAYDYAGNSVSSAGDVNGDGFDDVIVGAFGADPNGSYSGSSYVVFGAAGGFAASINLSTLNGTNGFRMDGVAAGDRSGNSVASAGDFNGDGFADLIVGADQADPNGLSSGSSYIVFGAAGGFAASINLSTLNGMNGFRLDGVAATDRSGRSVSSAGDVNGDGFDDLLVSAHLADPNGNNNAGSSYIIFGHNDSGVATMVGTSGADTISGTTGNDVIVAGLGNDVVSGFDGNDVIKGANGDDALYGGIGTDKLFGDNGADTLIGGAGVDTLEGGDGIDRFTYTAIADSAVGTPDMITDFNASADLLVFSGLLTGAFSFVGAHGNAFAGGGNSSARFNDTTKLLEIDTDGNAAADMSITLKGVELANLSAADFSWS